MDKEAGLNRSLLDAVIMGIIKSAHDISEGGLGIALAEGCISGNRPAIGASISIGEHGGLRPDMLLFSESQSRAIVTIRKGHLDDLMRIAETNGIVAARIGVVGGERLRIELPARGTIIDIKVDEKIKALPVDEKITPEQGQALLLILKNNGYTKDDLKEMILFDFELHGLNDVRNSHLSKIKEYFSKPKSERTLLNGNPD